MSYKVGDKVHVEFDAVITANGSCENGRRWTHTLREVENEGTGGLTHYVYLHKDNAEVIETEPASWPPRVGDVWEADGVEYFVYAGLLGLTVFPFTGVTVTGRESYSNSAEIDKFKALKPTLVRRAMAASERTVSFNNYVGDYFNDYRSFF